MAGKNEAKAGRLFGQMKLCVAKKSFTWYLVHYSCPMNISWVVFSRKNFWRGNCRPSICKVNRIYFDVRVVVR